MSSSGYSKHSVIKELCILKRDIQFTLRVYYFTLIFYRLNEKFKTKILISYHVIEDTYYATNEVAPGVGFEPTRPKWVTDSQLIF